MCDRYVKISNISTSSSTYESFPSKTEMSVKELKNILSTTYLKYNSNTENIIVNGKMYSGPDDDTIVSMDDIRRSTLIIKKLPDLTTKCQYDEPYSHVTNQCSWFSFEILNKKNAIIEVLDSHNYVSLVELYHECLDIGTSKRKLNGTLPYGENIDQVSNNFNIQMKTTQYGDSYMLDFLDDFVKSLILRPNLPSTSYTTFMDDISNAPNNTMVILNRDGKSFVFIKHNLAYWVFDSHKRNIYLFVDKGKMFDYIIESSPTGFFYILYGFY